MAQERTFSIQETDEKFGRLWFASLAKFHRVSDPTTWDFDEQHVIAFLRSKVKKNVPAWKRLKIVQGVIWYRNHVLASGLISSYSYSVKRYSYSYSKGCR